MNLRLFSGVSTRVFLTALLSVSVLGSRTSAAPKTMSIEDMLPDEAAAIEQIDRYNPEAIRRAIADMRRRWPETFKSDEEAKILAKLTEYEKQRNDIRTGLRTKKTDALKIAREMIAHQRNVLLRNPLIKPDKVMLIERRIGPSARKIHDPKVSRFGNGIPLGVPWRNTHSVLTTADPINGWNTRIAVLSKLGATGGARLDTLYKANNRKIITHLELDFDASRIMFTTIGAGDRWSVFEAGVSAPKPRQITPEVKAIDFFDACYMPDGNVFLMSTAQINGLPCEGGTCPVGVPFVMNRKTGKLRQIGFDQETSWDPSIMNDGRILYLRYEYIDLPHYFPRIPFTCNPDGTNQKAYCLSNSYWPNSLFGLRAMPGHASRIIGTATGHHGPSRMGVLVIVDPAKGEHETNAAVQTIPGYGVPVKNVMTDVLYGNNYPKAMTPWPLNDTYILVTMKLSRDGLWGLYLVDTFDNLTLICQQEDCFYTNPILLAPRKRPPVLAGRSDLKKTDATLSIQDIYTGPGLKGIPRGTVKSLRVISFVYPVTNTGSHAHVGIESGWDIKRVLGTVPVEADGSAHFTVPANLPIALQPLDAKGRALQTMRSWLTAMPGEKLTCIGCHERSTDAPKVRISAAMRKAPVKIQPWRGPPRPFGFANEVQPLLDERCVGCHDGKTKGATSMVYRKSRGFSGSYRFLQQFVRRPGPETDNHLLTPMSYHASTSPLIRMLAKGHKGVKLTKDEWSALYTWIDLNAPYHGSIFEMSGGRMNGHWKQHEVPFVKMPGQVDTLGLTWDMEGVKGLYDYRMKLMKRFSPVVHDPQAEYAARQKKIEAMKIEFVMPEGEDEPADKPKLAGWPFDGDEAAKLRDNCAKKLSLPVARKLKAGELTIDMVLIPAGKYVSQTGVVTVDKPFYISAREISLGEFQQFDPAHDNRFVDRAGKDQRNRGISLQNPKLPAIRVSWDRAIAFCQWLGKANKTNVSLPSNAQWEHAARAGSDKAFWFGDASSDYAKTANFADKSMSRGFTPCRLDTHSDGTATLAPTTANKPNAWGLVNVFGNAAEWTSTVCPKDKTHRIVRGGSFIDLPKHSTADVKMHYAHYQPAVNVGFRIATSTP
ncbi:MAG: SUMF1/EgtB/PvdO family nonheme iron enzyme [Phycisphaerae bacterium]|jgi:formylglycine-generating enzyme required for sulfatase activity|nr:SUMF1/EgtB/PvdO family nonheme iron enzyme [Phycisphaerae bacterium]